MPSRSVSRIVTGQNTLEGAGFPVRRPFPTPDLSDFDPFLLLDEMGPVEYRPGEAKGAPDHPHRGFETVTYVLDGRMNHEDSKGNAGSLGPGDVQWMTAGRGVVHSEMPAAELESRGGSMHGFQLWVNLPRRDKMMEPRYQEIPASLGHQLAGEFLVAQMTIARGSSNAKAKRELGWAPRYATWREGFPEWAKSAE